MKVVFLGVWYNGGDGEEGYLLFFGGDWLLKIKGKKKYNIIDLFVMIWEILLNELLDLIMKMKLSIMVNF